MADRGKHEGRSVHERLMTMSVSELLLLQMWAFFIVLYKLISLGFRGVDKALGRRLEVYFWSGESRGEDVAVVLVSADIPESSCALEVMCCKLESCVVGGVMGGCRSCKMMSPSVMMPIGFHRDR
jgi:hypothetical protein